MSDAEKFDRALNRFKCAAHELDECWTAGAGAWGGDIQGYPDYLPTFDKFASDILHIRREKKPAPAGTLLDEEAARKLYERGDIGYVEAVLRSAYVYASAPARLPQLADLNDAIRNLNKSRVYPRRQSYGGEEATDRAINRVDMRMARRSGCPTAFEYVTAVHTAFLDMRPIKRD